MSSLPLPWRLLEDDPQDGATNMAVDTALLRVMEAELASGRPEPRPLLRLYSWQPATLSTGRNQVLERACDLARCAALGVPVVRRPTGGRGVLHEHELTFAVVAPATGPFAGDGVSRASASIAAALVRGLSVLGVAVSAAKGVPPMNPRLKRGACFAATARQEIVVAGKKLCGSAQFRGRLAFLQHGSLPLQFDVARQAELLGVSPVVLAEKALGLNDCLAEPPSRQDVAEALRKGFEREFDVGFEPSERSPAEEDLSLSLAAKTRADAAAWRPAGDMEC